MNRNLLIAMLVAFVALSAGYLAWASSSSDTSAAASCPLGAGKSCCAVLDRAQMLTSTAPAETAKQASCCCTTPGVCCGGNCDECEDCCCQNGCEGCNMPCCPGCKEVAQTTAVASSN